MPFPRTYHFSSVELYCSLSSDVFYSPLILRSSQDDIDLPAAAAEIKGLSSCVSRKRSVAPSSLMEKDESAADVISDTVAVASVGAIQNKNLVNVAVGANNDMRRVDVNANNVGGKVNIKATTRVSDNSNNSAAPSSKLNAAESFCLAGVAAVVSKTVSAPLERVKLLIQNQDEMLKQGVLERRYNGISDCFVRIFRQEGFYYLWRGNVANCIRYIPTQGFNFMFKDGLTALFARFTPANPSSSVRLLSNIAAGGFAGSLSMLFVYPLDYARTRLANDAIDSAGSKRHYKGLVDVWKKTYRSDRIAGLYRGFGISVTGIFVYRGLFFGLYDFLKPVLGSGYEGVPIMLQLFLLSWATTVTAEVLSYPLDTIRRRMMMTSEYAVKYNGAWDCTRTIVSQEGFMTMFKGCGANILRGIAGAVVLVSFDAFSDIYIQMRERWNAPTRAPGGVDGEDSLGRSGGGGNEKGQTNTAVTKEE